MIRRDLQFAERHQFLRRIQANFAKDFTGVQPFIGSKENEVALFDFQLLLQGRLFGFTEKLHDRRFPFAALHLDVSQTLGAKTLGGFGHGLHLSLRHTGVAFGIERLDHAAITNDATEHLELAAAEIFREIHDLHSETRIGLINSPTVHHFLIRNAREWRGHIVIERHFPNALKQALDQRVNVFPINERHLDIHLREFGLTIRPQILITVTARELEIFIHTRTH